MKDKLRILKDLKLNLKNKLNLHFRLLQIKEQLILNAMIKNKKLSSWNP